MQEETVICLHFEEITSATHIGKCRLCGQLRLYDEQGGVKIIKRGRIDGVLTMVVPPSISEPPIKKEEEVVMIDPGKPAPRAEVPPKPSGKRAKVQAYWEKNKEDILVDYGTMKIRDFLKRWHIPTTTWPKLKKLWGVESKGHRGGWPVKAPAVKAPAVKEEEKPAPGVDVSLTEHERFLVLLGYQQATREFLKIL